MGCCLSCLKGRKPQSGETEPLLPVQNDTPDLFTPKTRDLEAVMTYVSDNFVDITNLDSQVLTEPRSLPALDQQQWIWPELGPLGEQDEQILDQTYDSLKTQSNISLDTTTSLTVDLS